MICVCGNMFAAHVAIYKPDFYFFQTFLIKFHSGPFVLKQLILFSYYIYSLHLYDVYKIT